MGKMGTADENCEIVLNIRKQEINRFNFICLIQTNKY